MASLAGKVTVSESPKLLAGTGKDQVHLLVVVNTTRACAAVQLQHRQGRARLRRRAARSRRARREAVLPRRQEGPRADPRAYPKAIAGSSSTPRHAQPGYAEARRSPPS
jgi:F-type H+-transporting ATPase subunit gamma